LRRSTPERQGGRVVLTLEEARQALLAASAAAGALHEDAETHTRYCEYEFAADEIRDASKFDQLFQRLHDLIAIAERSGSRE
jgi:hypothetical protein